MSDRAETHQKLRTPCGRPLVDGRRRGATPIQPLEKLPCTDMHARHSSSCSRP